MKNFLREIRPNPLSAYLALFEKLTSGREALIRRQDELIEQLITCLEHPGLEKAAVIELWSFLSEQNQQKLLPTLINQGLYVHGLTSKIWSILKDWDKDYVLAVLRTHISSIFTSEDGYEILACMLEFLTHLDAQEEAIQLAKQCRNNANLDIADVAENFLLRLQ